MNTFSMILSALFVLMLTIVVAPGILAMNRGKTLRNIALWLAIALGLALVYQTFGPGRKERQGMAPPPAAAGYETSTDERDSPADNNQDMGYTPPREE